MSKVGNLAENHCQLVEGCANLIIVVSRNYIWIKEMSTTPEMKVPVLEGKDAEEFQKYNSRVLTLEEKASLKKAHDFYKKHCRV
ncbi:hypothetical protein Ngar_c04680 [Candidatus Nitrososphaera gargensis Ga9.2]|uniref:Uncharacterized protein n=1 Tax=Nitrososphaera gargensis (strain Ga9.2) TaxID=1237085 RepID=K0IHT1_NITGG|nr:hypothetical protein [Candidatus Nitrososphaera gargensis]AFU57412.1 hypothetical protein Ngar_c04680 [Candidatus Nitrososphaera gargensis Ga9.2]